jgi:hypothetical protein
VRAGPTVKQVLRMARIEVDFARATQALISNVLAPLQKQVYILKSRFVCHGFSLDSLACTLGSLGTCRVLVYTTPSPKSIHQGSFIYHLSSIFYTHSILTLWHMRTTLRPRASLSPPASLSLPLSLSLHTHTQLGVQTAPVLENAQSPSLAGVLAASPSLMPSATHSIRFFLCIYTYRYIVGRVNQQGKAARQGSKARQPFYHRCHTDVYLDIRICLSRMPFTRACLMPWCATPCID